jgi:hypothetical protein
LHNAAGRLCSGGEVSGGSREAGEAGGAQAAFVRFWVAGRIDSWSVLAFGAKMDNRRTATSSMRKAGGAQAAFVRFWVAGRIDSWSVLAFGAKMDNQRTATSSMRKAGLHHKCIVIMAQSATCASVRRLLWRTHN